MVAQSIYRLGYRLDDQVQFLAGAIMGFSLVHSACYPMDTGGSFSRAKVARA